MQTVTNVKGVYKTPSEETTSEVVKYLSCFISASPSVLHSYLHR